MQDVVVLHVRLLRRAASGEYDLTPDQLFSTIEQLLFTKVLSMAEKEGKPVRLAVASANDLWDGILRAAVNLESAAIAVGSSAKRSINDQAVEIGLGLGAHARSAAACGFGNFHAGSARSRFFIWGRMRRGSRLRKSICCIRFG